MNKPLDPNKPVQTRDGRPARIICTDAKGKQPIIALVKDYEDSEAIQRFTKEGVYWGTGDSSKYDLVNIPEEKVEWINYYGHRRTPAVHLNFADALSSVDKMMLQGMIRITKLGDKVTKVELIND